MHYPNTAQSLLQSKIDILDDFSLLSFLVSDTKNLFSFVDLHTNNTYCKILTLQLNQLEKTIEQTIQKCTKPLSQQTHDALVWKKHTIFSEIRSIRYLLSAYIQRNEWQSPAYFSTQIQQTGRHIGDIKLYQTDYKRDRHLDAQYYEHRFIATYYPHIQVNALLTNSGMAAITTVYAYLASQKPKKVLMGVHSYHENKELAVRFFGEKAIVWVNEENTQELFHVCETVRPSLLLFDSLTNSHQLFHVDLQTIISQQEKQHRQSTIVIDNTCLSVFGNFLSNRYRYTNVIQVESLAKYHQFGLDKVTGGIIVCHQRVSAELENFREHLGTNISDISPYVFPSPNIGILKNRLKRMERNAQMFSIWLTEHLKTHEHCLQHVFYPQFLKTKKYNEQFLGSCVVIAFLKAWDSVSVFNEFSSLLFESAKKAKIHLVNGTSFGFSMTRMYLVASHTLYAKPFVRIAFGTETQIELERFIRVFEESMHKTKLPL